MSDQAVIKEEMSNEDVTASFNEDLIRKYPRANRKVSIHVSSYGLLFASDGAEKGTSIFISPHGVEFQTAKSFSEGTLLKISVTLPDYWQRKQRFVDYTRVDAPNEFRILAKVIKTQDVGKRGRKKIILAQTVNMDEIDEQVLKTFLQEG